MTSGIPQGTVLASLLFLCFVNDIPETVHSKIRLYADDILLYSEIHSLNDCLRLQNDINNLVCWSKKWQLYFNPSKCEHLCISNKRNLIKHSYYMDNSVLQEVASAKYLGVTIDSRLTWSDHITKVVNKANSVLGFLQRNLKYCPPEIKTSCYKSLVIPILEYACTSWSPYFLKDINSIEMVQRRAARFVFNDYSRYTSVAGLLSTLNWPTLQRRRTNLRAIMMYKIINNLIRIPADQYLVPVSSSTRNSSHHYKLPYSRVNAHLFSYFPFSIRIWNRLNESTACSPSLRLFKDRIMKDNLDEVYLYSYF